MPVETVDRLKHRAGFLAAAKGVRANAAAFTVQSRRRDDDGPVRLGFTVSRKVGTATERNRVRRRLRELVTRVDAVFMQPHCDYVIIARRVALTRAFDAMLGDLQTVLKRLRPRPAASTPTDDVPMAARAARPAD